LYISRVLLEYDEIGIRSEVKLAIICEYAAAYTKILEKRRQNDFQLRWLLADICYCSRSALHLALGAS
jgi:hypothetical protein